jgi:formaldehyde-activating enzyme involved in methanogenesis
MDPELLQAALDMFAAGAAMPQPTARDDWKTVRANSEAALAALESALDEYPSVSLGTPA